MITFVPAGGLGNRMRAVASAVAMAKDADTRLQIIWFQDWGLGCNFDDLFLPLQLPDVKLREASILDLYTLDRPRKKNFFLPALYERICFKNCLYEKEVTERYYKDFDFLSWCKGHNVYMASCIYFYSKRMPRGIFDIFHPQPELQKRIDDVAHSFPASVVGVHIRRTDNAISIQDSPTDLFIERMKKEPKEVSFFLATDSEEVKEDLKREFGKRIITSQNQANRSSVKGMQDALVELYTLSRTSLILGSSHSTFSESAAEIGDIQCEIIQKS